MVMLVRLVALAVAVHAEVLRTRYTHFLGRNVTRSHISSRGCERDASGQLRCNPIVVFVGRGHTGSANLAAYLQSHPSLDYGTTKEHRFFTRSKRPRDVAAYRRQFPVVAAAGSPPYGFDATPEYGERQTAATAKLIREVLGPHVKILVALRYQADLIMSQRYIGDGEAFHRWTLANAPRDAPRPGASALARRWCHNTLVETYVDLFGAENVLVVISETMRRHRDRVLEEIHDFLGVDRVPTSLPVMNVCKKDRYGGAFEGCYNGSSKVLPATRAVWRPFFEGCNARLAASFGVSPEALFAGRPTRRRLPP